MGMSEEVIEKFLFARIAPCHVYVGYEGMRDIHEDDFFITLHIVHEPDERAFLVAEVGDHDDLSAFAIILGTLNEDVSES